MSDDKSLATRTRQRSHSLKQELAYKLGLKKRGYSKRFLKEAKLATARGRVVRAACYHLFFPGRTRVVAPEAQLSARVIRADGVIEDLGILSTKVITDAFVNYVVDQLQSSTGGIASFRYHAAGIGATAESQTDTALSSEVETRAIGTQTEGASANIYRTVGTVNFGAAYAIREHGLLRASSGDILADRSVFAPINVGSGDAIEFTYELTLPAGS
jgi:hypothetical protein